MTVSHASRTRSDHYLAYAKEKTPWHCESLWPTTLPKLHENWERYINHIPLMRCMS